MSKKAPEPPGESAPMWIVSFADLVTLMMSFFVVLYALKQGGKDQQMQTTAAIKAQFGYEPPIDSNDPLDMAVWSFMGKPKPPHMNKEQGRATSRAKGAEGTDAEVTTIRMGKEITSGGMITFDAGSTELDQYDLNLLERIAEILRGHNNVVMIKGHASADELSLRLDDPNAMSLSYRRAVNVCEALIKLGINRRVLRPVACGSFEPLRMQVYDANSLRQNRRVEVFTTEVTINDYTPSTYVGVQGTVATTRPAE